MKPITMILVLFLLGHSAKAKEEGTRFETLEAWKVHVTKLVGKRFSIVKEFETEDSFFLILRDRGAFLIFDLPRGRRTDRPSFEATLRLTDGSDPVIGWEKARNAYEGICLYDEIQKTNKGVETGERYYHGELLPVRSGILTDDVIVIFRTLNLRVPLKASTKSEQEDGGKRDK